jgi:hypothetical protein
MIKYLLGVCFDKVRCEVFATFSTARAAKQHQQLIAVDCKAYRSTIYHTEA